MKEAKESGEPVVDRKPAAAITDDQDDDIAGAVIEGRQHGKQQSRQRVCRDGKPKSGQPCFVMEEDGSSRDHHLRARSMSALQENEEGWIVAVLQLSSDCMPETELTGARFAVKSTKTQR